MKGERGGEKWAEAFIFLGFRLELKGWEWFQMASAHPIQAKCPRGIARQAPSEEVDRIRVANPAWYIIDRGGEEQNRKDLAVFSGFRAAKILEIEGIARADPLEDLGREFAFTRVRNFRQVVGKHGQARQSHPLRKPFRIRRLRKRRNSACRAGQR